MVRIPVSAEFVAAANAAQLASEAGDGGEWPACFRETDDGWVYEVQRDDVDEAGVQAAIGSHRPEPVVLVPSVADRLALIEFEVRGMKERAAGEAAKATPTAKGVASAIARDVE